MGKVDLIDQMFGEPLDEILLAADMIVERHRADTEVIRKAPHCYCFGSLSISERERFG
jgi:hypothetical protein